MSAVLDSIEPKIAPFDPPGSAGTDPENPALEQTWSGFNDPLRRYGHSKFDIMGCILGPLLREGGSWGYRW